MKLIIVFAAIVAVALAASVPVDNKDVTVLRYENDNIGVEGYKYA